MNSISNKMTGRCDALVDALRAELGGVLASRIIEAEAADFLWESRVRERYIGQQIDPFFDGESGLEEVSRIAVLSLLDGCWYAAACLVDGGGSVVGMLWNQPYSSLEEAEFGFLHAR